MAKLLKVPVDVLHCVASNHSWDLIPSLPYQRNGVFGKAGSSGLRETWRCDQCQSLRFRVISGFGELLYASYEPSDHYLAVKAQHDVKASARVSYHKAIAKKRSYLSLRMESA